MSSVRMRRIVWTAAAGIAIASIVFFTGDARIDAPAPREVPPPVSADSRVAVEPIPQASSAPAREVVPRSEGRRVLVVVRDAESRPVSDVAVVVTPAVAASPAPRTLPDGTAALELPPDEPSWLELRKGGYGVAWAHVTPEAERVDVTMRAAAGITGKIVRADGLPPHRPVDVLALPSTFGEPTPAALPALRARGIHVVHASVDAEGRFVLAGLREGERYDLHVGGSGLAAHPSPPRSVAAGTADLVVEVGQVCATWLRFRSGDGEFLPLDRLLSATYRFTDPTVRFDGAERTSVSLALAGADASEHPDLSYVCAVSPRIDVPLENVRFHGVAPGGAEVGQALVLQPLGVEPPRIVDIVFPTHASCWGTLVVEPAATASAPEPRPEFPITVTVVHPQILVGGHAWSRTWVVDLYGDESQRTLRDIPCGEVRWSCSSDHVSFAFPSGGGGLGATVGPGEPTRLRVPFDDRGGVRLPLAAGASPWEAQGRQYHLRVGAAWQEGESILQETKIFRGREGQVLWGLRPGYYELRAKSGSAFTKRHGFFVEAGKISPIERLEER